MIGWNFPSNNFGQVDGLNNAGIETFKGNPVESLSREVNQNSCDAKMPNASNPVEVHFSLHHLPASKFPKREDFWRILNACHIQWHNNEKARKFFDKALETLNRDSIAVLKISDYNTTGLRGSDKNNFTVSEFSGSEGNEGSDWFNLIKAAGASAKSGGAGGSFGIGKNAPFACSDLRTVFYTTKDCDGKVAFQGVATLVTHNNGKESTQGTGYYGLNEKNLPIIDMSAVEPFFHRDRIGTDIFIMGFNASNGWEAEIIKSVLEHFFVAVHEENLIVWVGDTVINKNSLPKLMEGYKKRDTAGLAAEYYAALTSAETHRAFVEKNFEGLGHVELFVQCDKNFLKRVAMVRATGMKIYDKGSFRTPMKFSGVLLAKGEKLNELLRGMEPPCHNAWEPARYEDDPSYAKTIYKKLNNWIIDRVKSISQVDDSEQIDIDGMSQFLPDESDDTQTVQNNDNAYEGTNNEPAEMEVSAVKRQLENQAVTGTEVEGGTDAGDDANLSDGQERNSGKGGNRSLNAGVASGGIGAGGSKKSENDHIPSVSAKTITLKGLRVYCADDEKGIYNISFNPTTDGTGYLALNIVGEDRTESASLRQARNQVTQEPISVRLGKMIGPVKFFANKRMFLEVTLREPIRCALEVAVNAS